jgi:hypothetical protein
MHDGAPAYFSLVARRHLNRNFLVGGPIAWPPCSLDFYLWGNLNTLVYSSPGDDVETLQNLIVASFETIRNMPGIWDHLWVTMRRRAEACIQAVGRHIYCNVM